jgi:hypothetical protein
MLEMVRRTMVHILLLDTRKMPRVVDGAVALTIFPVRER